MKHFPKFIPVATLVLCFFQPVSVFAGSPVSTLTGSSQPAIGYQPTENFVDQNNDDMRNYSELSDSPLSAVTAETTGRAFYVDSKGTNNNECSSTKPCQTIQYAVNNLKAGDTLYIMEGHYTGNIKMQTSGTIDNYITIEGVGEVVLDGKEMTDERFGFATNGRDFIRFRNLEVDNMPYGVWVGPDSMYIEVDGLEAYGNKNAVRIESSSFVTVKNVTATNSNNAFRVFGTSRKLTFENVEAYNSHDVFNGMDPDYLNGDGFIFEATVSDVTIRNAVSANNWDGGFDIKASNVTIENAEAYGNKNNFKLWGDDITVKNSLSYAAKRQVRSDGSTVEGNGLTIERGASVYAVNLTIADNEDHEISIYDNGKLRLENSIVARRDQDGKLFESDGSFSSSYVIWYILGLNKPTVKLSATDAWIDPGFINWAAGDYRLSDTGLTAAQLIKKKKKK